MGGIIGAEPQSTAYTGRGGIEREREGEKVLTARVAAVAGEAGLDTLVAGLLGGRRTGRSGGALAAVVGRSRRGGLSDAWHLLMCRESRSLRSRTLSAHPKKSREQERKREVALAFVQTGHRSAGICMVGRRYLSTDVVNLCMSKAPAGPR